MHLKASASVERKCDMVAWIRDSGDLGTLVPAWASVCRILRTRAPLG